MEGLANQLASWAIHSHGMPHHAPFVVAERKRSEVARLLLQEYDALIPDSV